MITDPWFYAVAVPAVLIAGISKGGFGGGIAVMAVPLMSLSISPPQAAAILLPLLCLMDLFGIHAYRRRWDAPNLRILVPAALVGIAIGAATFRYLEPGPIRLLIGTIAIGFALFYWLRPILAGSKLPAPRGPSKARGGFWGALAGFTSFVAHAGGPPLSVYLLPQRLDKSAFVGTTVVFFLVVNYVKLVPYAWLGQFTGANLMTALVLAPLVPIGMGLGFILHRVVPERLFYEVCYVFVFLTGTKLIYDGFAPVI
ncbi:MAG: sulfite exporter TauE/SafE family protein [Inquilinaceae bacterium]